MMERTDHAQLPMKPYTHFSLLHQNYHLLLSSHEQILTRSVWNSPLQLDLQPYSAVPTYEEGRRRPLPYRKCISLHTLLGIWQRAPHFKGETVLYLGNQEKELFIEAEGRNRPVKRISRQWIAAESGRLRQGSEDQAIRMGFNFYGKSYPGDKPRLPYEVNEDLLKEILQHWGKGEALPPDITISIDDFTDELPQLFLPLQELIRELQQADTSLTDELTFLSGQGAEAIRQALSERGLRVQDFKFHFFNDPADEQQLICRILLPPRDVRDTIDGT
ncbi:MAG: hypothetical protein ACLFQ0_21230, partial [Cyclobacteriaceae bacterium]